MFIFSIFTEKYYNFGIEPNQVNINVDGQNDACSKNEDINFHFKGFGLSGRVVTESDSKILDLMELN